MCLISFRKHSGRVNHMEKESNIDLKDFETEKESVTIQSQEDDIENETKSGNPLVDYFETKLSNIEKRVEKDSMQAPDTLADNRSYSPQLWTFIKKYITEMPLWSGVLLGRLDRYRKDPCTTKKREVNNFLSFSSVNAKSEGYIEGAMRNLKQEDFSGRKRLRADTFVYENYS